MQEHHELWFTELLNNYLAAPAKACSSGRRARRRIPSVPGSNFIAMEILVALIIIVLFGFLRSRLSVDKPGKLQHIFEDSLRIPPGPVGRDHRS